MSDVEFWTDFSEIAGKEGGHEHARILYRHLIKFLETGDPGALEFSVIRNFLSSRLNDMLKVNSSDIGNILGVNYPRGHNTKLAYLPFRKRFIQWYIARTIDDGREPSKKEIEGWAGEQDESQEGISDRLISKCKKAARCELKNPKSPYVLFHDISFDESK